MLKRGNWSVEELQKLRENYGRRPLSQLARELRRTEETVRLKARLLFEGRLRVGNLTGDETDALRAMLGIADLETVALVLGRSTLDVLNVLRDWAACKRTGRFAAWETAHLKTYYSSRPDWALVVVLGRAIAVIRRRAREFCLGKDRRLADVRIAGLERAVVISPQPPRRMPRWTPDQVATLRAVYSSQSNVAVAKILGRSVKSVIAKANDLGLKKSPERLADMGRENVGIRYKRRRRS